MALSVVKLSFSSVTENMVFCDEGEGEVYVCVLRGGGLEKLVGSPVTEVLTDHTITYTHKHTRGHTWFSILISGKAAWTKRLGVGDMEVERAERRKRCGVALVGDTKAVRGRQGSRWLARVVWAYSK